MATSIGKGSYLLWKKFFGKWRFYRFYYPAMQYKQPQYHYGMQVDAVHAIKQQLSKPQTYTIGSVETVIYDAMTLINLSTNDHHKPCSKDYIISVCFIFMIIMCASKKLFFLLLILLFACKADIDHVMPELTGITESVYASGTIKSLNQYQVYATVSGIISEVFVREGDTLKKGNPILSISNEEQTLSRQNAALSLQLADVSANKGKLRDAQMAVDLAKSKMKNDSLLFNRQSALWKQNIGTKVELEQRELTYKNSRNAYYAAVTSYEDLKRQVDIIAAQSRNSLAISEKLVGDYTLRSEIDGVVYELLGEKGELVVPQSPVGLIGDPHRFLLELQVDEHDIVRIKKGMRVLVTMDSYKDKVYTAVVSKIDLLMNKQTKTFTVEAEFIQRPPLLYPNTSLEANIIIQSKEKALLIPRSFMLNDSTVLKTNGETVVVKTGLKDFQKIEILSGISQTDELKKPGP